MHWLGRLHLATAELAGAESDPWRRVLERAVPANVMSISSVGLLDLVGVPPTTGNCRRLAVTMRAMGWVGLKSWRPAGGAPQPAAAGRVLFVK